MNKLSWLTLIFIVLFSAIPRLCHNSWDDYHALHPDERFLVMVANDIKVPRSVSEYLDPARSSFNPYNATNERGERRYPYFVYGTLPVTVNKLAAHLLGKDHFNGLMQVGRALSALADLITLVCWYFIARLLAERYSWPTIIAPISSALYGMAVLPIQLSHFFAVDTFLAGACAAALLSALYARFTSRRLSFIIGGICCGVAFACKITALYMLPLILTIATIPYPLPQQRKEWITTILPRMALMCVVALATLRIADTHYFATSSPPFFAPEPLFITNIKDLIRISARSEWPWPPGVQWLSSTPIISPTANLFWVGLGPVCCCFSLLGLVSKHARKAPLLLLCSLWGAMFFVHQGSQFTHTMRYFILIYPLLTILAGLGITIILQQRASLGGHMLRWGVLLVALFLWPKAFMSIYAEPHPRVEASRWLLDNIPAQSVIATEHWDDSLPLSIDHRGRPYEFIELPVFEQDSTEKWLRLNQQLQRAQYIVLSSNRGYGSMCKVREKYPRICEWYDDLFNGSGEWQKIYEVYRKPSVTYGPLSLAWDTQQVEEAFSVYDHPRVMVFKRVPGPVAQ